MQSSLVERTMLCCVLRYGLAFLAANPWIKRPCRVMGSPERIDLAVTVPSVAVLDRRSYHMLRGLPRLRAGVRQPCCPSPCCLNHCLPRAHHHKHSCTPRGTTSPLHNAHYDIAHKDLTNTAYITPHNSDNGTVEQRSPPCAICPTSYEDEEKQQHHACGRR